MKTMKKVLAFMLALAMVVTAVPVTNAQAATPVLEKSKNYYAGKTYTLKLTTPSSWKSVSTVWSATNNNTKAVAISDKKTKSVTVKALKKGKAVVTAKVTYKKSGVKTTKTYKCNVRVKAPTIAVSPKTITVDAGKSVDLTTTYVPASGIVSYESEDKNVATVKATKAGAVVSGVNGGETNIKAYLRCGKKVKMSIVKVTVNQKAEEGLSTALTNPVTMDYENTVLVNENAVVNVKFVKDGKPAVGETVILTVDKTTDYAGVFGYGVVSPQAVTDKNGVATFVIRNANANVKANSDTETATVYYTATVPSSGKSVKGQIAFASIYLTNVYNTNWKTVRSQIDRADCLLVPGTNFTDNGYGATSAIVQTASMDDPDEIPGDEYVMSQQVSSDGNKEHAVSFKGGFPVIKLPGSATDLSNADKEVDPVNYESAKYGVYNGDGNDKTTLYYTLKVDPSKLTYATMNFTDLKISAYTRLVIETYKNEADAKASWVAPIHRDEINGEKVQDVFGYQIPLDYAYSGLCVKVFIESAGQVDLEKNSGYKVKDVVYVYKKKTATNGQTTPLKNAKVEWSIVPTSYTVEKPLAAGTYGTENITLLTGERLTYKVPVFPYTGTAVITKYDANNKPKAYYAIETKNDGLVNGVDLNTNVLPAAGNVHCYQISEDELRDKVGEIVAQDGSTVTVDSEKSGRTTLEGKVTVGGEVIEGLDAETNAVYTSVQWNPVKRADDGSDGFVALLGQTIDVVAQLVDKNGNAVAESGVAVKFEYNGRTVLPADTKLTEDGAVMSNASIVDLKGTTDKNGQGHLKVKASVFTEIVSMTASTADTRYFVKLKVADKTIDKADLYWVDANIEFKDTAIPAVTTTSSANAFVVQGQIAPKTGSNWEYGVYTTGQKLTKGALKDKTVTITGLGILMNKVAGSVGEVTATERNGVVTAKSTKAGKMSILTRINKDSLTKDIAVSAGTYAGEGQTTINKRLTLEVDWKANGIEANFISVNGNRIYNAAGNETEEVYVKVTDINGNPIKDRNVTFTQDDTDDTVTPATIATNAEGIAKATLTHVGTNPRTTVTAKVDNLDDKFETTYTWVAVEDVEEDLVIDESKDLVTDKYLTFYNHRTGVATLTFKADIVETSVIKEMITATYNDTTAADHDVALIVDEVIVNNNVVTIKFTNSPAQVNATDTVAIQIRDYNNVTTGITTKMTSVDGVRDADGDVTYTLAVDTNTVVAETGESTTATAALTAYRATVSANQAIATDAATVVTNALSYVDKPASTTIVAATTGANGTTIAYTETYDPSNILAPGAGTLVVTTTGNADKYAYFKVEISKVSGTTVTKYFTVTVNAGADKYTVTESTAKQKAEAAIENFVINNGTVSGLTASADVASVAAFESAIKAKVVAAIDAGYDVVVTATSAVATGTGGDTTCTVTVSKDGYSKTYALTSHNGTITP